MTSANSVSLPAGRQPRNVVRVPRRPQIFLSILIIFAGLQFWRIIGLGSRRSAVFRTVHLHAPEIIHKCSLLDATPGPAPKFYARSQSDRFVSSTRPTLIVNATVWTGGDNGLQVVHGNILLDGGLIKQIGRTINHTLLDEELDGIDLIDAQGKWVSPGIVDLHSHIGVYSIPSLQGTSDFNSRKGPILPWLRALDGLNTHDDAYRLSVSGGVTTALVIPGSANAIGGQGAIIKLRPTAERSPTSLLLENPYEKNITVYDPKPHFRYRQMKHACGENPGRVYSSTRMDTVWAFRQGYEKARQIKQAQDGYCAKVNRGEWAGLGEYPEDLQWEALVDVLRGRVKVHIHCYETVDLDDLVRISNEFEFSIAAFHHAHETYLVPDTLKSACGGAPAAALFGTHARYKRESYRGSEFAPRILADNGIRVVMKSDHPVLDSRFLIWEVQQAHFYGLPPNLALAAVTTTPAGAMGQDHRIGYVKEGYDADIILWDSHPLALGATPQQVWIDGIPQLSKPRTLVKPSGFQHVPIVPNFDTEAKEVLKHDGLPPLEPKASVKHAVVFANISSVYLRTQAGEPSIAQLDKDGGERLWAIAEAGKLVCIGPRTDDCVQGALRGQERHEIEFVDLDGGSLAPGLTSFGSPLGLEEISGEISTKDGSVPDALTVGIPSLAGGSGALLRAVDGLQFSTRHALIAYRAGVTTGVVAPANGGFFMGLNTAFSTGAKHKPEKGAVVQEAGAVHVSIHHFGTPSVSTQIAALRHLLLTQTEGELGKWFDKIRKGIAPLVIGVESADIMATLVALKSEVEHELSLASSLKFTFAGGREAHLLAGEIGKANIGVILTQPRPFPREWEARRILPGPPLSETSGVVALLNNNVTVGLGVTTADEALNTRFDAARAALESDGVISKELAFTLVSTNMEELLGVPSESDLGDLVATRGGDLLEFSKVAGVISPRRGIVDVF